MRTKFFVLCIIINVMLFSEVNGNITATVKVRNHAKYDVYLIEDGKEFNLTNFKNWEAIDRFEISRDKKYIYVWHKPKNATRKIISIYDIPAKKISKQKKPWFWGRAVMDRGE